MSRVQRVVAKGEDPGHGYIRRESRSKMEGKRFDKLIVGELVKPPSDRLCRCDCGQSIVMRTTTIGLRIKQGLPVNCGKCEPQPEYVRPASKVLKHVHPSIAGSGKKEKFDIPYIPPPPCEVNGECRFFKTCKTELKACLSYYKYIVNGANAREENPEPNEYLFDQITPGIRYRTLP